MKTTIDGWLFLGLRAGVPWMRVLDLLVHVAPETDEQDADDQTLSDDTGLNDVDARLDAGALLAVVEDGVADDAQETGDSLVEERSGQV